MTDWFQHGQWLGNTALAWVIAGACALAGYLIAHSLALFLNARLAKLAQRTHRQGLYVAADVAAATRGWLLLLIAIVTALDFLHFGHSAEQTGHVQHALQLLTWILVGMQIAFWVSRLLASWLNRTASRAGARPVNPVMLGVLTWAVQFVVWVTLVLVLLNRGGVNITAFVASLGVGGVAVALALQNVLGDLFASISIGLDKPFEVGDAIAFDSGQGTVTKVGIKSTRLQSQSGEELAISNSVLLKSLIHNYSRMQQRRVVFNFRLPFDTPRDKLPTVVERVREFIDEEKLTRFDRGYLSGFGEYGLDFEFVYYVLDPAYNTFVEIQQRINLKMLDAWDELGIEFAVPARKVHAAPAGDAPIVRVSSDGA
ncbi:MAG: Potassium efflux system KefA protein / Small-conductance mechanosensitive channel [Rhodanobacteraceae bacterium]|jgi:small-conductance mechanosensitive channel|nr:MAG: Potassium efflux system KefA protein / Small-conductance mechanosensitive channel [Rhodanobacteraceae bacterium]